MKTLVLSRKIALASAAFLVIAGLLAVAPAKAAGAPVGRTYFVVSLGVAFDSSEAYEIDAGSLHFTRNELCETDGDCGVWWRIEDPNHLARQSAAGFQFDLTDDETGLPVRIEGRGRIDARGPKSSIAAVAQGIEPASGVTINFALAGRAVGARKCERLAAQFAADQERAQGGQR